MIINTSHNLGVFSLPQVGITKIRRWKTFKRELSKEVKVERVEKYKWETSALSKEMESKKSVKSPQQS